MQALRGAELFDFVESTPDGLETKGGETKAWR